MFELAQRFGFNLTDTFTRYTELLAHFFKRVIRVHADAKRIRSTRSSRGVSEARTRVVVSLRFS